MYSSLTIKTNTTHSDSPQVTEVTQLWEEAGVPGGNIKNSKPNGHSAWSQAHDLLAVVTSHVVMLCGTAFCFSNEKVGEFIDFRADPSVTSCTSDLSVKTMFVTYELLCS